MVPLNTGGRNISLGNVPNDSMVELCQLELYVGWIQNLNISKESFIRSCQDVFLLGWTQHDTWTYQHVPGAVWTQRNGVQAPLIIHSAPLGRSRYVCVIYSYGSYIMEFWRTDWKVGNKLRRCGSLIREISLVPRLLYVQSGRSTPISFSYVVGMVLINLIPWVHLLNLYTVIKGGMSLSPIWGVDRPWHINNNVYI